MGRSPWLQWYKQPNLSQQKIVRELPPNPAQYRRRVVWWWWVRWTVCQKIGIRSRQAEVGPFLLTSVIGPISWEGEYGYLLDIFFAIDLLSQFMSVMYPMMYLSNCGSIFVSLHHEFRIQQFPRGNRLFGNSVLNLHELLFYFREFHRAGISFRAKYTTKAGATGIFLTWRSNANEFRAFRYACIGLGDVGGQSSTVNKKRCKDLQFVKSLFKKTNLTFYAPLNPL